MSLRYLFGTLIAIPLLPVMYFQGKRIRKRVPTLPEAKDPEGTCWVHKTNPQKLRIITLGESTLAGVGVATHQEGFTGSFAAQLADNLEFNIVWKVYAKSGFTAKEIRDNIVPTVIDAPTDLILVGTGGNDAFTLNTPWAGDRIFAL